MPRFTPAGTGTRTMLISDEVQRQVLPVIVKATSVSPTGDAESRSASVLQLNPGQQVKAEIIATLPNHLYLARIANEMFKIELPVLVEPGQLVGLTFVTADPRVTFEFAQGKPPESVQLTSLGRWLSTAVQNAPPLPLPDVLLQNPLQAGDLLGPRLKESLVQSGLFYESHLAQWVAGRFPLGDILMEPQGKLSKAVRKEDKQDGREPERLSEENGYAEGSTLSLVKEQLSLLKSGFLGWKGEAWPGQEMDLVISREKDEAGEPAVLANLSVDMPALGKVDAVLHFTAEGLSLELVCDRSDATRQLKAGAPDLKEALAFKGVRLNRMGVRDGDSR